MLNQRQLRENTIQLLYAYQMAGEEKFEEVAKCFFDLTLEPLRESLYTPLAKWILNQALPLEVKLSKIQDQCELILPQIKVFPEGAELVESVSKWQATMHLFQQALGQLKVVKSASNAEDKLKLNVRIRASLDYATQASLFNQRITSLLSEVPAARVQFEAFFGLIENCEIILKKIVLAKNPNTPNDDPQFSSIYKKSQQVELTQNQVNELGLKVVGKLAAIDEEILPLVENFTEDRLDALDFSILRLGAYELLYTKVNRAHVLNDLIEVTKKFSTQNSSKFINGVLDKL